MYLNFGKVVIGKKNIVDKMIDIIFPNVCGFCGRINDNNLCKKCENILKRYFVIRQEKISNEYYDEIISFFNYDGFIRDSILGYKFKEKPYMAKSFVEFLLKQDILLEIIKTYDKIIPVPISKKRYKERGYNQSFLIAKEISNFVNIEVLDDCLFKTKNIIEQSKLGREDRVKNVQGVYALKNLQIINNKKILLVDDIYTTGSTVNECSRILLKANPSEIGILVLATTNEGNRE